MEKLGIDVGGVIIAASNDHSDTSFFEENYLLSKPTEGMYEAIAQLVTGRFDERTYIVSKCGERIQQRTREWLQYNDFYNRTGMHPDHVCFTRTREGKAPICTALGITHFVDDRLDVLRHLTDVPHQFLFQGHANEMRKYKHLLTQVCHVHSWQEIVTELL